MSIATPTTTMRNVKTQEDIKRYKLHLRRKFRALVYHVIANLFWLEDADDIVIGDDVKKNVQMLLKKKKDKTSLLTFRDKSILCKEAEHRTQEEKDQLFKVLGDLKCFRKYPLTVKQHLAAICYFVYFPPGRIIVKQFRDGEALYFIMSGEVQVSIEMFDPILNEMKTSVVGTMQAGQMFGEVSLLHNIPRTATIATLTDCELVKLHKDDFNRVLKGELQEIWNTVLNSMSRFRYFDGWDDVSLREACIYSKMKTYRKDEIMFEGDDTTVSVEYTHFILKGQCRCIQALPVIEEKVHGIRKFKLFDKKAYQAEMYERRKTLQTIYGSSIGKVYAAREIPKKFKPDTVPVLRSEASSRRESTRLSTTAPPPPPETERMSVAASVEEDAMVQAAELRRTMEALKEIQSEVQIPSFVKIIFMQIALFNELACFGLGEEMAYRTIVAASDEVKCLLIPKYWLWTKNKANLWTQVIQTLNAKLPTVEDVFEIFTENRRWGRYQRKLVNKIRNKPPCNVFNNIPYSIRLRDDIKYGAKYR